MEKTWLDAPPEEDWPGKDGTIYYIIDSLGMARGSYGTVKNTLQIISKGMYSGNPSTPLQLFDPSNAGGHHWHY